MIKRIIQIGNPARLNIRDNQLVITQWDQEHTIPCEDIGVVVLEHREISLTSAIFEACDMHSITILHCNKAYMPVTMTIPLYGHTSANTYLKDQLSASLPAKKQLWTQIIREKIRGQIQVLKNHKIDASSLEVLVSNIKSGDSDNIEWQAAARYWKLLFGMDFLRERREEGINAWLNYGYGIIRATIARSVVAGWLHPSIGIWHDNQFNYFNLVDDLIEPFRPLVDEKIKSLTLTKNIKELTPEMKREIISMLTYDITFRWRNENMTSLLVGYVASFREWLISGKMEIPDISSYLRDKEI